MWPFCYMCKFWAGSDDTTSLGFAFYSNSSHNCVSLWLSWSPPPLEILKSPFSCLCGTCWMKDFSYLIAANFSNPKTGRFASTNQRSPGYPLGTALSNVVKFNMGSIAKAIKEASKAAGHHVFLSAQFRLKCLSKVNLHHWIYISFPAINARFKLVCIAWGFSSNHVACAYTQIAS